MKKTIKPLLICCAVVLAIAIGYWVAANIRQMLPLLICCRLLLQMPSVNHTTDGYMVVA